MMENTKKPKALIITGTDLGKSGVPYVIFSVVKSLHDCFDFHIITLDKGNCYYYERLNKEGVSNVTLEEHEVKKPRTLFGKFLWLLFLRQKRIRKITKKALKRNDYSLIHCFVEFQSWGVLKTAEKFGIEKRILHINIDHKIPESKSLKTRLLNGIELRDRNLSLKYATERIGVSNPCCEHAFGNVKYTILYNSYDQGRFNHNLNCPLSENQLVLAHVASISRNKNQMFAVKVAEELKKYVPNFKLLLIGWAYEKDYSKNLNDYICSKKLNENVEIINGNDSIEQYLCETSYGLLPSLSEAASIATIEFQACGIPIFVSDAVPSEMNCGGAIYQSLEDGPEKWARTIWLYFQSHGNKRENYDVSRFSDRSFKTNLMKIYGLK